MKILMFGWEFPPLISGGLGTACFGLTQALTGRGHEIVFVLPRQGEFETPAPVRSNPPPAVQAFPAPGALEGPEGLQGLSLRAIASTLRPYGGGRRNRSLLTGQPASRLQEMGGRYGTDLIAESMRYGRAAGAVACEQPFDVIHAHDWMTVFAGIEAQAAGGRPFVLHIHALEFDRSGEDVNSEIYDIERLGMERADRVIAVSRYTKSVMVDRYGVNAEKIDVVHNAVARNDETPDFPLARNQMRKTVLFLGRITFQKGPDYFIEAAARVLKELPDVTFVMAGAGDMMPRMVERVAELGIGANFHFTGFLTGEEVDRMYAASDLYVMPSVSEPFGITPLEAMRCDVPVIISRQSGVSEIIAHALKVDFWNVAELADKMIAVLRRPALAAEMVARSREALQRIRWEDAAVKIENIYHSLLRP
jgi:glycosyltransferase involved in cell wall biosynthesis